MISENDFFVAVQAILENAREKGVDVDQIIVWAYDAVEEWREKAAPEDAGADE